LDIVQTVRAMTGGSREILTEMRSRYNDAQLREIILAASALWALIANAREHQFVSDVLTKYPEQHGGTPAARVISLVRPKPR
jgi:hypothetical protein